MQKHNSPPTRLRLRLGNAWWMLREGRFRLFIASIAQELRAGASPVAKGRRESRQGRATTGVAEYADHRDVNPPSYRPTGSMLTSTELGHLDERRLCERLQLQRDSITLTKGVDE